MGGAMIVEENGKMRTEKGEVRAILHDAKFVCAECYRVMDPNLERVSVKGHFIPQFEVQSIPHPLVG
jgi:hypothetical protein